MNRKFQRINELSGEIADRDLGALALHEGVLVNRDLSCGCAFKIECDYTLLLGDDTLVTIHNSLRSALNALPDHFDIQVIWRQHHRTREFEEALASRPVSAGLVGDVQQEIQDRLLAHLKDGGLRWVEVYFLLVRQSTLTRSEIRKQSEATWIQQPRESNPFKRWWLAFERKFTGSHLLFQYQLSQFRDVVRELMIHAENFRRTFEEVGWEPKLLNSDEVLALFYQRWNPRKFDAGITLPKHRPDEVVPVTERFIQSPFTWTSRRMDKLAAGTIELDGFFHRIIALHEPPTNLTREGRFPLFADLLMHGGLTHSEVIVNVRHTSRERRMKELDRKLKQQRGKPAEPAERETLNQLDAELTELGSNQEKVWKADTFFHVWAESPDKLDRAVVSLTTEAARIDCKLTEETHAAWQYWRSTQPFWTSEPDRYRALDYTTRQVVCLLPLCGHPTNVRPDKPIGVLYETAAATIYNFVLPDGQLFINPHHIILGDMGSGKSVMEDEKQIGFRRLNAQSVIVDLGGSFRNFCESSGGVYIDYDLNSAKNRVNPFFLPQGSEIEPEFVRGRALWLEAVLKGPNSPITGDDVDLLEEAVESTFRKLHGRREVLLRDVRDMLNEFPKPRANTLAGRLSSWCADGGGTRGNLFDGPSAVSLTAPVVVFDLKRVARDNRDAHLTRVIFNSIISLVAARSVTRTAEPKLLTFDEAGDIVKDPDNAQFMEYCVRTLRKNGVIVAAMTQDVEDFTNASPSLANIIVDSVSNRFVLKQGNAAKVARIARALGLNRQEQTAVASLGTAPGRYAELLLVQNTPRKRRSLRLVSASTPLRYAFTCNSDKDLFVIDQLLASGLTRPDAIRRFAQMYPRGVENSPRPSIAA